jgi:SHS2 domain-containing protein
MAGEVLRLEHTGDAGIEARADSLRELFETAARGMLELIAETGRIEERETVDFHVEGADPAGLLVAFLGELHSLHDARGLLFRRVEVTGLTGRTAAGRAHGERHDPARHVVIAPIKAVTYHGAEVVEERGRFRARIIFDL